MKAIIHKEFTLKDILPIIIGIFGLILIIMFFIIQKNTVLEKRWKFILIGIGATCVIIVCYSIFNQISLSIASNTNRLNYNIVEIKNKFWSEPFIKLIDQYPESTIILKSLFPQAKFTTDIPTNLDETKLKEINFSWSQYFIQNMEDFLSLISPAISGKYNNDVAWCIIFIQWLTSPILRNYWEHNNTNYGVDTQKFVNQLIEASKQYEKEVATLGRSLNYDELKNLTTNISYSPRI